MPGHLLAFCPSFARLSPKIKAYLRDKQANQQFDYHYHDAGSVFARQRVPGRPTSILAARPEGRFTWS